MVSTAEPVAQMGVKPLIYGTLWVVLSYSSLPIALAAAIYLSEIAKKRTRNLLTPLIELLAGIPSVVYGFFGWLSCPIQSLLVYLLVKLL
jgi:phosphate transport system permease protein